MAAPVAAGRRERTKLANREAILDAARAVFAERGFGAAGVVDIVRRSGLSQGTFYNYFPDKESIFRALVEESIEAIRSRLRAARQDARSVEEFVGGAYRAYFEAVAADPTMFQLMRRNAGAIRALMDDPVLAAGVDELLEDLSVAIARGELPAGLDAGYMARAMAGAGLEIAMEMFERGGDGAPDVDGAARFASALFLGGIERMGPAAVRSAPAGATGGAARDRQ